MVKVKICGLTRPADVEVAMELGADALGFIHEPSSPRYISDPKLRLDLTMTAGPFLPTVAVYGKYTQRLDTCCLVQAVEFKDRPGWVRQVLAPNFIPIPDSRPGMFVFRFELGTPYEEAVRLLDLQIVESNVVANAIVIDSYSRSDYGGTGVTGDWGLAEKLVKTSDYPVILAGGLTPDNVSVAIQKVRPYAVDVSSGIEASPGVKDPIKMRDFIQAAREA
jgi:phosphoribosylanthranilate isomerase